MPSTGQTECTFNLFLERGSLMSLQAVVEVRAHPTVRLCFKLGDTSQAYGRKKKNLLAYALSSKNLFTRLAFLSFMFKELFKLSPWLSTHILLFHGI